MMAENSSGGCFPAAYYLPSHFSAQKRMEFLCKVPVIAVRFQPKLECTEKFQQNSVHQIS
jgi:hypothetical protein